MVARSTVYSLVLAAGYGVLATTYIVVSSALAADHSATIEELRRIETVKGILFVAVMTAAVFFGCWFALRRMANDADELLLHERALVASQGKVFAGVMAASVAHDANNVLTAVLGDLEMVANAAEPERAVHVTQLRASIERLVALNRRLLGAARHGMPKEQQVGDLARLVRDSVAVVRSHASLTGCRVVCTGDSVPISTQPLLVHQVVSNLVLNAGEAAGAGGVIEVVTKAADDEARIEVHDNGPGIPAERRSTLFDAMTTTKPSGSGLGLFSARACVHGLGGTLEVGDSPLGGALLRVRLPRHSGAELTPA